MPIQSLPTETITRILELGTDPRQSPHKRYAFLTAAVRVCRLWRAIAQPLLERRVHLSNHKQAILFLAGRNHRHGTSELALVNDFFLSTDVVHGPMLVRQVAEACPRLTKLTLDEYTGEAQNNLHLVPLQGLVDLTLKIHLRPTWLPVLYRFQLVRLSFDHLPSLDILKDLLKPSVRSLCLHGTRWTTRDDESVLFLSNIAHQLVSVLLSFSPPATFLKPFLERCTNVKHLTCNSSASPVILLHLPGALNEWTVLDVFRGGATLETIRETLASGGQAVSTLRRLHLELERNDFVRTEGSVELQREGEVKGIELNFGARWEA